jgi:4-aminobutyrate aminotransferase-like enzyme
VELSAEGAPIVSECLQRGLLINCTQQNVLRLLPAMTLTDAELDEGCELLVDVLRNHTP